jgi:putative flippase GtrA
MAGLWYNKNYIFRARNLKKKTTVQLTVFVAVGMLAFAVDMATFSTLTILGIEVFVANFISISISTLVAFLGHLFITFQKRGADQLTHTSFKFLAVALLFGLLNYSLSTGLILFFTSTRIGELAVKACVIAALALFRFMSMKWWVFT